MPFKFYINSMKVQHLLWTINYLLSVKTSVPFKLITQNMSHLYILITQNMSYLYILITQNWGFLK